MASGCSWVLGCNWGSSQAEIRCMSVLPVCMTGSDRSQKKISDPLKLGLQMVMSFYVGTGDELICSSLCMVNVCRASVMNQELCRVLVLTASDVVPSLMTWESNGIFQVTDHKLVFQGKRGASSREGIPSGLKSVENDGLARLTSEQGHVSCPESPSIIHNLQCSSWKLPSRTDTSCLLCSIPVPPYTLSNAD
ncbi:hypothetical protein STEG23_005885, partial [Scotinomys teguina]